MTSVIPEPIRTRREQVRAFMEEHVYPNEGRLFTEDEHADTLVGTSEHAASDRVVGEQLGLVDGELLAERQVLGRRGHGR